MNGNMYFFQKTVAKGHEAERLDDAIRAAVKHFSKKYGYYPEHAVVFADDFDKSGKYPIKILKVWNSCPPSHFILCPILTRRARIFSNHRQAFV